MHGTRRKILIEYNKKEKHWLGHVLRESRVMKNALEGRMVGKKTEGTR